MIFSNRKPETVKFFYDTESITISDKYTYLGIQFTRNGNLKEAVSVLCDKAMKGMFSLYSSLYIGLTITPRLPLKVFDNTVRPILAYGSEVWSAEFLKLKSKPNLVDKALFEMVNNTFCKYIAGMPNRTSNFDIKAELRREPIFCFISSQAFRYWRKLASLDSSREILKGTYESELEIHKAGDTSWVAFIAKLLDSINSNHFLNTTDNVVTKGQMGRLSDKLKTQLSQDYFQYNFQNISEHSKLRTYVKFKLNSNREDYLDIQHISLKHRNLFCSFRIRCHDLEIERGISFHGT